MGDAYARNQHVQLWINAGIAAIPRAVAKFQIQQQKAKEYVVKCFSKVVDLRPSKSTLPERRGPRRRHELGTSGVCITNGGKIITSLHVKQHRRKPITVPQ